MANQARGERVVSAGADAVRAALAEALKELGWEWSPGPRGGISAVWISRIFRFKDDVAIELIAEPAGKTRVRIHSRSRVGRFDFGQNARHVRQVFSAIEAALPLEPR